MKQNARRLFVAALALVVVGCGTTYQTRSVEKSGFLGDYSQLQKGTGDQAQLVFIDSKANWATYHSVMIDSVVVRAEPGRKSLMRKVSEDDLQMLADYLHTAMRDQLEKDYKIVDSPGPGVMRIRPAITEAKGSKVALDLISNALPPAIAMSTVKRLATGTHSFVGEAGVEVEVLDTQTTKRLAAAVDRRAGRKVLRGKLGTWNDVKAAYDHWANRLRVALAEQRAKSKAGGAE